MRLRRYHSTGPGRSAGNDHALGLVALQIVLFIVPTLMLGTVLAAPAPSPSSPRR